MTDTFAVLWMLDGQEPDDGLWAVSRQMPSPSGPLYTLDNLVAYLVAADWEEGYKPWVRKPDGAVLNPDEVMGYLLE